MHVPRFNRPNLSDALLTNIIKNNFVYENDDNQRSFNKGNDVFLLHDQI